MTYAYMPTPLIADGMGGQNIMSPEIKALSGTMQCCGSAYTVQMVPGDNLALLRGIYEAKPGQVLVVDAGSYTKRTVAGDFVIGLMKAVGLAGLVTNGCVRDKAGILAAGFPVWCLDVVPAASCKQNKGRTHVPIQCGGVAVCPGDIIMADEDGIAVIPEADYETIIKKAGEKLKKDEERAAKYLQSRETAREYLKNVLGEN